MLPPRDLAVLDPADYCLDKEFDGMPVQKHLWTKVIYKKGVWSTVFSAYSEYKYRAWSEPMFRVTRLKKHDGFWRYVSHYCFNIHHIDGLLKACLLAKGLDEKLAQTPHELRPCDEH